MFFLQLVGAALVALLILILALYLLIRWKLRSFLKGMTEAIKTMAVGAVPPFRIQLEPRDDEDDEWLFSHKDQFLDASRKLTQLGFQPLGQFKVNEIMLPMNAFVDTDAQIYAVVYDHAVAGVWCDLVRGFENGNSFCYANSKDHLMDRAPWSTQTFFPDMELAELVKRFRNEAPQEGAKTVSTEEFPKYFARRHAMDMDWRINRGGLSEAEIRRIAERDDNECTPEMVNQIQANWREAISEFFKERCLKNFLKQSDRSRLEQERLRYGSIVIHERMQAEQILNAFDDEFYPDEELDSDMEEDEREAWMKHQELLQTTRDALKQGPPQQAFRELLRQSGKIKEWEFCGAVQKPISADIWVNHALMQELGDEFEEEEDDYEED